MRRVAEGSPKRFGSIFVLTLLAVACADPAKQPLDTATLTQGLWVRLDSKWEPHGDSGSMGVAYARVLKFSADGQFSWIACMLLRNAKRNEIAISPGDGQVFFFGRWQAAGDRAIVEYVKVREMVHVAGSDQPFEKKQTVSAELIDGAVIFDGLRFTRSFVPDTQAYEKMVSGVRKWEADKLRSYFPP